jgi:hypothetical protein
VGEASVRIRAANLAAVLFEELVVSEIAAPINIEEWPPISHPLRYMHFHSPSDPDLR